MPRLSHPLHGSLIASSAHFAVLVDDVVSARESRDQPSENPQT